MSEHSMIGTILGRVPPDERYARLRDQVTTWMGENYGDDRPNWTGLGDILGVHICKKCRKFLPGGPSLNEAPAWGSVRGGPYCLKCLPHRDEARSDL